MDADILSDVCEDSYWYWVTIRWGEKRVLQPAQCHNDEHFGFDLGAYHGGVVYASPRFNGAHVYLGEWELLEVCDMPGPGRLKPLWESDASAAADADEG